MNRYGLAAKHFAQWIACLLGSSIYLLRGENNGPEDSFVLSNILILQYDFCKIYEFMLIVRSRLHLLYHFRK